jgi:hypothetical protein
MTRDPNSPLWFRKPANFRRVLYGLFGACTLFVLIDIVFFLTGFDKHPHFRWEQWPGFYAVYGFVACVVLVLVSRFVLRPLVMRREDYYDPSDTRKGGKPDA